MGRILVVDDDAANRYFMVVALRQFGHEVVEARTGLEALDIIERDSTFDLILSDLRMPQLDGVHLMDEFRRRFPTIPVVVATAYSHSSWAAETISQASACLSKPFSIQQLLQTVQSVGKWPENMEPSAT